MRIQSVGNYDCQRKNDVNFKAVQNGTVTFCSTTEALRSMPVQVYKECGIKDLLQHPLNGLKDAAWTISNRIIGWLVRTHNINR